MARLNIKICGLTTLADALAAVEAGADLLGFNFYPPSPRYLTPAACAAITADIRPRAPGVRLVGVFVNEPPERVAALLAEAGLDLAQLHGEEAPAALAALAGRAFKAFRGLGADHAGYAAAGPGAPAFLLDAYSPTLYGGTGQTADWTAARPLAQQYPLLLAGGLTPANVAEAIAQVRPWGVDVASGVEAAPGRKDAAKVAAFIRAARSVEAPGGSEGTAAPRPARPPAP
ncbi:MAG: phosphoribosylanthranilate isomerase [Anaerolineales bacterium]|nr:phosphoribosylanthranilate isomerase [Anaerolineales bacterium]